MKFLRAKKPSQGLDLSPLIDCVFQLLIFFMLSSSFLAPSVRLSLPRAAAADPPAPEEIVVSIDAAGRVFLNARAVSLPDLAGALRPLLDASSRKTVTFKGDRDMPYRLFVEAVDAARRAGAANVRIAHAPAGDGTDGDGR